VNERIRAREIRLIDENNEQMGIMFTRDAFNLARSRDLDLVEVAPNAVPPVCRIMDYGKFRYEQGKRDRESRRSQHNIVIKEVRLGPNTDEADVRTRINMARRFLDEGHKVKFTVQFHGRELAHTEIGRDILNRIAQELGNDTIIEAPSKMEGKRMSMIVSRKQVAPKAAPRPPRPAPENGSSDGAAPTNGATQSAAPTNGALAEVAPPAGVATES
jgi:translation initiation factor IF-3